jgi:hypothetical protein
MECEMSNRDYEEHAAYHREANKVLDQIHDHFRDTLDPTMFQDALRFALDSEKAASRCARRGCRTGRACQIRVKDGERLDCGAGVSDETLVLAAKLALFAHTAWFDRWWAGVMRS